MAGVEGENRGRGRGGEKKREKRLPSQQKKRNKTHQPTSTRQPLPPTPPPRAQNSPHLPQRFESESALLVPRHRHSEIRENMRKRPIRHARQVADVNQASWFAHPSTLQTRCAAAFPLSWRGRERSAAVILAEGWRRFICEITTSGPQALSRTWEEGARGGGGCWLSCLAMSRVQLPHMRS